ncbi:hypothetical protein ACJX0J_018790, partial [Zea mays]
MRFKASMVLMPKSQGGQHPMGEHHLGYPLQNSPKWRLEMCLFQPVFFSEGLCSLDCRAMVGFCEKNSSI